MELPPPANRVSAMLPIVPAFVETVVQRLVETGVQAGAYKGRRGVRFSAPASIVPAPDRAGPCVSRAVASPMPVSWNQIASWLKQIDALRQVA